jgi:aryl-alcohol dehydrogenase-like predicted oxidoreductase
MEKDEFGKTLYVSTEDSDHKIVERVGEIATKRGVPRAQVALAWMAQKSFVTAPIIGASKLHHLDDAVAALTLNLTSEEIAALEEPYTPRALAGFA